jgi:hypothetical protein
MSYESALADLAAFYEQKPSDRDTNYPVAWGDAKNFSNEAVTGAFGKNHVFRRVPGTKIQLIAGYLGLGSYGVAFRLPPEMWSDGTPKRSQKSYAGIIDRASAGEHLVVILDGRLWSGTGFGVEVTGDQALRKNLRSRGIHHSRKAREIRKSDKRPGEGTSTVVTHEIRVWINCSPRSSDATEVDLRGSGA